MAGGDKNEGDQLSNELTTGETMSQGQITLARIWESIKGWREDNNKESRKLESKLEEIKLANKTEIDSLRQELLERDKERDIRIADLNEKLVGGKIEQEVAFLREKLESGEKAENLNEGGNNTRINIDNNKLTLMLQKTKMKMDHFEKTMRKNNIVITGLQRKNQRLIVDVQQFLQEKFSIGDCISEVWQARRNPKIIFAKLTDTEEKRRILEEKKEKLKGTSIYIDNDRSREEREIARFVNFEAKKLAQDKNNLVTRGFKGLTVNGIKFTWDEMRRELVEEKSNRRGASDRQKDYRENTQELRNHNVMAKN